MYMGVPVWRPPEQEGVTVWVLHCMWNPPLPLGQTPVKTLPPLILLNAVCKNQNFTWDSKAYSLRVRTQFRIISSKTKQNTNKLFILKLCSLCCRLAWTQISTMGVYVTTLILLNTDLTSDEPNINKHDAALFRVRYFFFVFG